MTIIALQSLRLQEAWRVLLQHSSRNHLVFSACLQTLNKNGIREVRSLSLPDDDNALSPLHCFLRKYCVEAFSATEEDVAFPRYGKSHGGKIVLHQVGIRCMHCKSFTGIKPERAVCYPSSLKNIYHSIETWQRRHAPVCRFIPSWIKRELTQLIETSKSTGGGRRQYWQDAAQKVGMVDTLHGVRFGSPPGIAFHGCYSRFCVPVYRS